MKPITSLTAIVELIHKGMTVEQADQAWAYVVARRLVEIPIRHRDGNVLVPPEVWLAKWKWHIERCCPEWKPDA